MTRFYSGGAGVGSFPAQLHSIQRFGSRVNLHVHVHAVVSEGAFSLNGGVMKFHAADPPSPADLARSIKRLSYKAVIVRYWPKKGHDGSAEAVEFKPADFMAKFARLIPPARIHLVRYHGALGPRSPLREAVTQAAREQADFQLIRDGLAVTGMAGAAGRAARGVRQAVSRAARSWAACLGRIFEIDAAKCGKCGGRLRVAAVKTTT